MVPRVLLIEDEPIVREMTVRALTSSGFAVVTADDGVHALELFAQYQDELALVLMDLGLPKVSGSDVYRAIRLQRPDLLIVAMTGYGNSHPDRQFLSRAGVPLIDKPFRLDELAKHLAGDSQQSTVNSEL